MTGWRREERGGLGVGLGVALALHVGLAWLSTYVERPVRERPDPPAVVARATNQRVDLPKPPPPPPKLEPKLPPPKPGLVAPKDAYRSIPPKGQPKDLQKTPPKPDAPPPKTPPPLVLSRTYEGGPGGVEVQKGDQDLFGDPSVKADDTNTKPRIERDANPDGAGKKVGPVGEPDKKIKEIDIFHAVPPRGGCPGGAWPASMPPGDRRIEVRMQLTIDEGGEVSAIKILKSGGAAFDEAARETIQKCRFRPGKRDGRPIVDRVPYVIEFRPPLGGP